jgi:CBS domain-containing protein
MLNPFHKTTCREVMKMGVVFVTPDDDLQAAATKMRVHDVGFLPVCGKDHRPIGVLTDRDIVVRAVADDKGASTLVSQVMTMDAVCVGVDADLGVAEALMMRNQKSRIMCVDAAGQLVGVVSLSDVPGFESSRKSGAVFAKVTEHHVQR